jgi:hypothetical protein
MLLPVLRKLVLFAVLGFATVMLIGPVLAVVGTLLPFALVGALVWLAYKGVRRLAARLRGPERRDLRDVLREVRRGGRRALAHGLHKGSAWAPAVRGRLRLVRDRVVARLEVLCGALVGALVCWSITGAVDDYTALGALVGAALGFVAGGPKPQPAREPSAAR